MRRPIDRARGRWGRRWLLVGLACACLAASARGEVPARIASLNLCTDIMLLELVTPTRIASVTRLARDPALSPLADRAQAVAVNHGLAEEMIAQRPDLVIGLEQSNSTTIALLRALGLRVETFTPATDLAGFEREFLRLAHLVDATARAHERLRELRRRLPPGRLTAAPRADALVVEASGYVPGPDTLADDVLREAGLRNAARDLDVGDGGFVALETLVQRAPRWLVVGTAGRSQALAGEFLRHPALRRRGPERAHPVHVPAAWWACGSRYFADAVSRIAAAVRTDDTLR